MFDSTLKNDTSFHKSSINLEYKKLKHSKFSDKVTQKVI
jgi:hypothetical protein